MIKNIDSTKYARHIWCCTGYWAIQNAHYVKQPYQSNRLYKTYCGSCL